MVILLDSTLQQKLILDRLNFDILKVVHTRTHRNRQVWEFLMLEFCQKYFLHLDVPNVMELLSFILYEEEDYHVWQSFFRIKCQKCNLQHANFPSSRYIDSNNNELCVNIPFRPSAMNEVTMRSVIATHSTGISWQSLHRIATVFEMITPLRTMPSRYVTRLEEVTEKAVKTSMIESANELHQRVDRVISPEPGAINITVSFDSSWKTRGYYSNIGFGAVISTNTKKVLDYEILSRLCELCSIWNEDKQKEQPLEYQSWIRRHKPNCNRNFTGSSQAIGARLSRAHLESFFGEEFSVLCVCRR